MRFKIARKPEPMTYESIEDYLFWRIFMFDHFG